MKRARPIAMVTARNETLNIYYNGASYTVNLPYPVAHTVVEHRGNAIRVYCRYAGPPYCGDTFEIAIDDIGFPGADVRPLGPGPLT